MELTHKKILQNMLYYAALAITIVASIFFMITLARPEVMLYAKIVFYIWTAVVIGVMILDIICTIMNKNKFISGLIIFVLSMAFIIMAVVVYFNLSTGFILPVENVGLFNRLIVFAGIIDVLSIITFIVGEFIIQSDINR